eukprot:GILJ01007233.1.p1 GENE.GILJ01007233.1~~GILJ01007233.1.p1  ORF type:complete len:2169 (+),score=356.63 GILJ01007233.1:3-6509(+)
MKCQAKYSSNAADACDSDATYCQYDRRAGFCTHQCGAIGASLVCEETSLCQWSGGVCVASCTSKYVTQAACENDAQCDWAAESSTCYTTCNASSTSTSCTYNPRCMFNSATGTCSEECRAQATCTTPPCQINQYGDCEYQCSVYSSQTTCGTNTACRWLDDACVASCEESYGTQRVDCSLDPQCMWDKVNGICAPNCREQDLSDCRLSTQCMVANGTCATSCSQVYTNFADCDEDPNCLWDDTQSVCTRTCTSFVDFISCNEQADCKWVASIDTCLKVCSSISSVDCLSYTQCTLDAKTDICKETCAFRYGTRGDCNADADCEWNSKSAVCGDRKCIATTSALCNRDSVYCKWNTSTKFCDRKPCTWSDASTCDSYSECEWYNGNQTCIVSPCTSLSNCAPGICTVQSNSCVKDCAFWGTSTECTTSETCDWAFNGTCTHTCYDTYKDDTTTCATDSNCMIDNREQLCEGTCKKLDGDDCRANLLCLWSSPTCKINCAFYYLTDEAACNLDSTCEYLSTGCSERCSTLNATTCVASPVCQWNGKSCTTGCAGRYGDRRGECIEDDTCMWSANAGGCVERCELEYTLQTCSQDTQNCFVYNGSCTTMCQSAYDDNAARCTSNPLCLFDETDGLNLCANGCATRDNNDCTEPCAMAGGFCRGPCNNRHYESESCNADSGCIWDPVNEICDTSTCSGTDSAICPPAECNYFNGQCVQPCTFFGVQSACTDLSYCAWDASTATCGTKCSYVTDTDACNALSHCFFADKCIQKCALATTVTDCVALSSGCYWDANQCQTLCEYKYTDAASCSADSGCAVVNNQCTTTLCSYSDSQSCNLDQRCDWDGNENMCKIASCEFADQASCEAGNCKWTYTQNGASCGPSSCRSASSELCDANPACETNSNGECVDAPCYYSDPTICALDTTCMYNATARVCQPSTIDCMLTDWSEWSDCSTPCSGGTRQQTRKVIRQPLAGGQPCGSLTRSEACNVGVTCDCGSFGIDMCLKVDACKWMNAACVSEDTPTPGMPCTTHSSQSTCVADSNCMWSPIDSSCRTNPNVLQGHGFAAQDATCGTGKHQATPTNGFVPYGDLVTIFNDVTVNTALGEIDAVMVSIEVGYQRDQDLIVYNGTVFEGSIDLGGGTVLNVQPKRHQGVWVITGLAHITAYASILSALTFTSYSFSSTPRVFTWSIGYNVFYSSNTNHLYYYNSTPGYISWTSAKAACESSTLYGVPGYLATVSSPIENNLLNWKLAKSGWIGATDAASEASWLWTTPTGTSNFWVGQNEVYGGMPVNGMYSAWEPAGTTSVSGDPTNMPGDNYGFLSYTGFWVDRPNVSPNIFSFFCEFGVTSSDVPSYAYGTATLNVTGCAFDSATAICAGRSQNSCNYSPDCEWNAAASTCVPGCNTVSDNDDCLSRVGCHLDTDSVPALCIVDICVTRTQVTCASDKTCYWNGTTCNYQYTCDRFTDADSCNAAPACTYLNGQCQTKDMCPTYLTADGNCGTTACQQSCSNDINCELIISGSESGLCIAKECTTCTTDNANQCNSISGNELDPGNFRPGGLPKQVFSGSVNFGTSLGFTVSISKNLQTHDQLFLLPSTTSTFVSSFDSRLGLLTVTGSGDAGQLTAALLAVRFVSNSRSPLERTIVWTAMANSGTSIGPVYLSEDGLFVEYVTAAQISQNAAAAQCARRTMSGVAGSLLRVNSSRINTDVISSVGATLSGWMGGMGTLDSSSVPVWSWSALTAGTDVFFRGNALIGSTLSFSNYMSGEPSSMLLGSVRYMSMDTSGKWETRDNNDNGVGGYYCSYVVPLAAAGSQVQVATLGAVGCLPKPCSYTTEAACKADLACQFVNGQCGSTGCSAATDLDSCNNLPGCYMDVTTKTCAVTSPADSCVGITDPAQCSSTKGCVLTEGGKCTEGCGKYADATNCANDPNCVVEDGQCVPKLCGSLTKESCLSNAKCAWDDTDGCSPDHCLTLSASECSADPTCAYSEGNSPPCGKNICTYTNEALCITDASCAWDVDTCVRNNCGLLAQTACAASPLCNWLTTTQACVRTQCGYEDEETCVDAKANGVLICQWVATGGVYGCATKSIDDVSAELGAAADSGEQGECTPVEKSYGALLAVLIVIVVVLCAALAALWYKQRNLAKEKSFAAMGASYDEEEDLDSREQPMMMEL